jgi:hypothetical protein
MIALTKLMQSVERELEIKIYLAGVKHANRNK